MNTNLITAENQSKMKYRILNMIHDHVRYLMAIEMSMSMFDYENEAVENYIFSFLLGECQIKFDKIK